MASITGERAGIEPFSVTGTPMLAPVRVVLAPSALIILGCEETSARTYTGPRRKIRRMQLTLEAPDYYEILQVSRRADALTIRGVYRLLAARFHPDNRDTGDIEAFLRVRDAYAVLSNPRLRRAYDATLPPGMARVGRALHPGERRSAHGRSPRTPAVE